MINDTLINLENIKTKSMSIYVKNQTGHIKNLSTPELDKFL